MKHFSLSVVFLMLVLSACQGEKNKGTTSSSNELTAQSVIDDAIEYSGTEAYHSSEISFDFRDYHFISEATCDGYKFSRQKGDTLEVLHNSDFNKSVANHKIEVADSMAFKFSESINSVFYFMQLPMRLNDDAVIKELKNPQTIGDKTYHVVEARFKEENGGEDHSDVYMYWFNQDNYALAYFAYEYDTNGGGVRFRVAKNPQMMSGVRFVDYGNYKPKTKEVDIENLLTLFSENKLIKVSEITNTNIKVSPIKLDCH
ncbi:MAG: DUF6503 family protein [Flavobacteriaceae bacterium]|nr:hypothetical protein [Psychroflexus sp.]